MNAETALLGNLSFTKISSGRDRPSAADAAVRSVGTTHITEQHRAWHVA
jgi:hypothetical protein